MSLTLHGFSQSRSFRALWALHEAGLKHQYIELDFSSEGPGAAKHPDYLKLNTQGKVPTLVHDDFVLTESAAILNYIDTLCDKSFVPVDARTRAKYDELSFFVLSELEQPLWTTGKHRFAIPEEHRVAEIFDTARWEFDKALNALHRLLSLSNFAIGESFSFADILLAQTFNWADRFKFKLPQSYLQYRDRMYQRAAALKALAALTKQTV